MKIAALVFIILLVGLAAAGSAAAPDVGSVTGTISLETGNPNGPEFVPAGTLITVNAYAYSGNPDAPHLVSVGVAAVSVPAEGKTVPFKIAGLPLGEPLTVRAEAHALNQGPHYWDETLLRVDAPSGAALTLTPQHPNVTSIAFSAKGARIPPDAAGDGVVPLGSIDALVTVGRAGQSPPATFPRGLDIVATIATDPSATRIGTTTSRLVPTYMGGPSARMLFRLTGLPLDTPLVLHLVIADGFATTVLPFRSTSNQRKKPGMELLADNAWHVTLTSSRRNVTLPITSYGALPIPAASAPPGTSGSFAGRIELSAAPSGGGDPGVASIDPATVRVVATRTDTNVAVGSIALSPLLQHPDGSHFLGVRITNLPLGAPIAISVQVPPASGPTPGPGEFSNLVHFRPKDCCIGSEAFTVTLDAAHPVPTGIVDFVPYVLEVVPPLPPRPAPSPTRS